MRASGCEEVRGRGGRVRIEPALYSSGAESSSNDKNEEEIENEPRFRLFDNRRLRLQLWL